MSGRAGALVALIAFGVVAAIGLAIWHAVSTDSEVATTELTIPVLVISAATLFLVLPRPARLVVVRQEELEIDDLIFYVVPQPNPDGVQQWPRDIGLQVFMAVCNVGGRTAVLSRVRLLGFADERGQRVHLPGERFPIGGRTPVAEGRWVDHQYEHERRDLMPPFVIEPDGVHPIRIGAKCGINWRDVWDLARLRAAHDALDRPIYAAICELSYRSAKRLVTETTHVRIQVLQQALYREAIQGCTGNFTTRPSLPEQTYILDPVD